MRYRLRTLLILMAVMPPMLAAAYWAIIWLITRPHAIGGFMAILAFLGGFAIGPLVGYFYPRSAWELEAQKTDTEPNP
jgi:hypothetical protein